MSTAYEKRSFRELFVLLLRRNLTDEGCDNKQDIIEKLVEADKAGKTEILNYEKLSLGYLNSIAVFRELITIENNFSLKNKEDYIALLKSADESDM
jgi:hypothetical protein